jgi:DNA-binding transcriptional ArsR family regulator
MLNLVLDTKKLQRITKGFANHRRIEMLELLSSKSELSLSDIALSLKINIKTASEHLQKLSSAGLILKRYRARNVMHKVSPLGEDILTFLRKLE